VAHAQYLQTSQAAQAGRNVATEPVAGEGAESASGMPQRCAVSHIAWRTHSCSNPVMLPMLDGMLPLSWLKLMELRAQAGCLSAAQ
jgi:hypothetical protein